MKGNTSPPHRPPRRKDPRKGSAWVTYLIGAAVVGLMFPFGWLLQAVGGQSQWLPVNLHSVLTADYRADPYGLHLPPLQLGLIADVLNDSTTLTPGRFATLEGNLTIPVPSVTPGPGEFTPTPIPGLAPSATPVLPGLTPTPLPSQSSSPTATSNAWIFTPTQPTSTTYATSTSLPTWMVTPTFAPTETARPKLTSTSRPPASTPTATLRPPPTSTPVPYPGPTIPPYP